MEIKDIYKTNGAPAFVPDPEYDLWWAIVSEKTGRAMQIFMQARSSGRLFEMRKEELIRLKGVNEKTAAHILYGRDHWNREQVLEWMHKDRIRFVPFYDPLYPRRLLQTDAHPFALFVKGKLPDENKPAVGVIGARECSEYGRGVAEYFGRELALAGVNVLSGMALGIDGISQMAALKAGGVSFAILGCGPDLCYPASNRKLYELLQIRGGVISEYGPRIGASSWHFPARNRILAGMSDLILVVEAREKSGTLITVDQALDMGKEVMVVPGRINDVLSVGCNRLWKAGATPAVHVSDVLEVLKTCGFDGLTENGKAKKGQAGENKIHLESDEKLVYSCFDLYAKSAEEALNTTHLGLQEFLKALTGLELKGLIRECAKGYYVRTTLHDTKQDTFFGG